VRSLFIDCRLLGGLSVGLACCKGGGFVIVPALRRYTDLTAQSIVATSLGILAIISGGGVLFSAISSNLD